MNVIAITVDGASAMQREALMGLHLLTLKKADVTDEEFTRAVWQIFASRI